MSGWNEAEYTTDGTIDSVVGELVSHETTDNTASTLLEAVKRIEEANLWKTLLVSSVFQVGSARPEIVESVNEQIKQFAKEKLEMCVGIKPNRSNTALSLPFDEDEISALKILAAKVLKKDPITSLNRQYQPTINPISSELTPPSAMPTQASPPPTAAPGAPISSNKSTDNATSTPNTTPTSRGRSKKVKGPGYIEQPLEYVPTNLNLGINANVSGANLASSNVLQSLIEKHK